MHDPLVANSIFVLGILWIVYLQWSGIGIAIERGLVCTRAQGPLQKSKQLCNRLRSEDSRFLAALIKDHKFFNSDFGVRIQIDEVIQCFSTASVYWRR